MTLEQQVMAVIEEIKSTRLELAVVITEWTRGAHRNFGKKIDSFSAKLESLDAKLAKLQQRLPKEKPDER